MWTIITSFLGRSWIPIISILLFLAVLWLGVRAINHYVDLKTENNLLQISNTSRQTIIDQQKMDLKLVVKQRDKLDQINKQYQQNMEVLSHVKAEDDGPVSRILSATLDRLRAQSPGTDSGKAHNP